MTRIEEEAFAAVPVFPLPNVVLFPEVHLPLHIFEPRYRAMLSDCLDGDGSLVIAQVDRDTGRIAGVAGVGVIVDHRPLADGRSNIVIAGCARVRLDELVAEDLPRYPYKRARATRLDDLDASVATADRAALIAAATMFVTEVKKHDSTFEFSMPAQPTAAMLADSCAYQLVVDAAVRQAILEELDPRVRVRMVLDQLALQHGAMLAEPKDRDRDPRRGGTVLN